MRIAKHSVIQGSEYNTRKAKSVSETLTIRRNDARITLASQSISGSEKSAILQLRSGMPKMPSALSPRGAKKIKAGDTKKAEEKRTKEPLLRMLEDVIFYLTGKKIRLHSPDVELEEDASQQDSVQAGFELRYDYHEVTVESESVSYEATGTVITEGGKQYSFTVNMNMSRIFYQETNFQLRIGNAVDPLVISLDGAAPQLSRERYAFDLDSDGVDEEIPFAVGGSGFLALDKNRNGRIESGTELFGPGTGNGFKELAMYDLDKNDWIDENDEVFSKLLVLTMPAGGEKTLFKLGDVGVGAIYLKPIDTPYTYKDQGGEYGRLRSSSVFLRENGTAGTVHHIDLTL